MDSVVRDLRVRFLAGISESFDTHPAKVQGEGNTPGLLEHILVGVDSTHYVVKICVLPHHVGSVAVLGVVAVNFIGQNIKTGDS